MIQIGDIKLTKEQQDLILKALIIYGKSNEIIMKEFSTIRELSDIIFNERKKKREQETVV